MNAPTLTDIDNADLSIFPPAARPHVRNWLKMTVFMHSVEADIDDGDTPFKAADEMRDSNGANRLVEFVLRDVNAWEWHGEDDRKEESHDATVIPDPPAEKSVVLQLAELIAAVNACATRFNKMELILSTWPGDDRMWVNANEDFADLTAWMTDILTREVEAARKAVANGQ
jgi:hypothetical protein